MHITPPSAVVRKTQPGWKPQRWGPSAVVRETQPGGKPQRWGHVFTVEGWVTGREIVYNFRNC
ncbi:hypothetical protein DPMN_040420 [Dreissena polymorpha]|uniref:Uncharacterized protein n=1 Tax=Dreissena polymorpha TaxID=45954 RepID=A0A9D4CV08_DREPO|nr:hypothetical protein DPMN_040420 [Dreissena polymorpha]